MLQHLSVRKQILKQRRFRELLFLLVGVSLLLGYFVVPIELTHPQANITNHFDGTYWAVTTLTTVGYGDLYPVTVGGKLIAITLQIVGALIFGTLVALVSAYFIRTQEEFLWNRLFERLDRLESEFTGLKKHSDFLVKSQTQKDEIK